MPLIALENVSLAYGPVALLDRVALSVEPGERVCLIGRNGAGKSTLLRIIARELPADEGTVWHQAGVRIASLAQDVPDSGERRVSEVVAEGLGAAGALVAEYERVAAELARRHSEEGVERLSALQHELEAADGWRLEQRVETVLTRLELDGTRRLDELSGGARRRALLARALVSEPDVLLLDEPTNHLDIDSITWLEDYLASFNGALLFITHDRAFLRRLATRIVELDRGQLTSWPGDYDQYLRRKEEQLAVEAEHNAKFDKKLSQEEAWIRQGIKARRTRNEGRVRALHKMREERARRRERTGKVKMALDSGALSGKLVAEAENISYSYDGVPVIKDFSTTILRGDRVGIIGPNGAGKTTLLRLLLGRLEPRTGSVRLGTRLQVAYFDQERAQLDPERSVQDNVAEGREQVTVNGRSRHVMSYLKDFLFAPERARSPASTLSGGERNRLLLARLFTQPANVLVLDEPTNDLDMETLELLEELLCEYEGTLLVVSHDRAFLDNVITSSLVFEGQGGVGAYVGGYQDWLRQRKIPPAPEASAGPRGASKGQPARTPRGGQAKDKPRKRTNKEQRELDALPAAIEQLEAEQAALQEQVSDPGFYQQDADAIKAALGRLEQIEAELERAFARWEELDAG